MQCCKEESGLWEEAAGPVPDMRSLPVDRWRPNYAAFDRIAARAAAAPTRFQASPPSLAPPILRSAGDGDIEDGEEVDRGGRDARGLEFGGLRKGDGGA